MPMNRGKTPSPTSTKDMLHKIDPSWSQEDDSLMPIPIAEASADAQTLVTKKDIHLLLVELHKDIAFLHQDFTCTLSNLEESIREPNSRLTVDESTSTGHALENVDRRTVIERLEKNYDLLQNKQDDLENHYRRNNVHIRGIAATIPSDSSHMFTHLLGLQDDQPVLLGRIHRVYSAYQQQKNLTLYVLNKVHYFHIKEKVMQAARHQESITFRGDTISIYQDASIHKLACNTKFRAVIHHLHEMKISYQWGFPLRLHFTYQDKRVVAHSPKEA
ncbi:hypothetical protein NDU88_001974 [Pleurodeles waltl]|uniref:Uncharacterized protein n=1 Tax=Pleurodeles waltl TaxID=8319 RepID=A0AAV7WK31_PLEWA|nr:hypothetical protein NDU88_001974 [Pleurodeles waltl]